MPKRRLSPRRPTRTVSTTLRTLSIFLALLAMVEPSLAGPYPDIFDNGRRRGSQDGAGGSNITVPGAVSVPEPVQLVEAFALSKDHIESCEPIEGIHPPMAPGGGCATLPGGVTHVAAGCAARNTGFCTVGLRGVEPASTLVLARLYVMLIIETDEFPLPVTVGFAGHSVAMNPVGWTDPPCWTGTEDASSVLYAADVATLVPPIINGDYAVTGLPSAITHGASPYLDHPSDPPLAQGAALVVAYSHERVPETSVVYIHEDQLGIPVLGTGQTIQHTLSLPTPATGTVRFTSIGADGQSIDVEPLVPYDTHFSTPATSFHLRGPASEIDPRPDWTGAEGGSSLRLFDVRTTEFGGDSTTLPTGTTSYEVTYIATPPTSCEPIPIDLQTKVDPTIPRYDCVNVGVHVLTACGSPSDPD